MGTLEVRVEGAGTAATVCSGYSRHCWPFDLPGAAPGGQAQ